jgi:hypothetical protein
VGELPEEGKVRQDHRDVMAALVANPSGVNKIMKAAGFMPTDGIMSEKPCAFPGGTLLDSLKAACRSSNAMANDMCPFGIPSSADTLNTPTCCCPP